jgi:hypothetical protein
MKTVSYELQARGVRGVLIVMAERGLISELRCAMLLCYCPGGRGYFDAKSVSPDDWIPSADHYPLEERYGGHLVPENVRLAHKRCNRLDFGKEPGHEKQRKQASEEQTQWLTDHPGKRVAAEALWADERIARGLGGYETSDQVD